MAQVTLLRLACLLALAAGAVAAPRLEAMPARPVEDGVLAPWSWPVTEQHAAVARVLRDSRRAAPGSEGKAVAALERCGAQAAEALLDILVRARVPETQAGDGPQVLSEPQRALVLGALAGLPRREVRGLLAARLAAAPDDACTRLAAIHLLGVVGRAEDLPSLARLAPRRAVAALPVPAAAPTGDAAAAASKAPEAAELTREARSAVRDACAGILRRDPQAWRTLAKLARSTDAPALRALLDGLGSTRDPRGLEILLRTARSQRTLAPKAVALVPALGRSTDPALDQEFAEWMRDELPYARTELARMLLIGIATLDDGSCAAALAGALEHDDAQVREGALRALRLVSGLGYGPDARLWRLWLDAEDAWHADEHPRLRDGLESGDASRIVLALQGYAGRRTHRAALAAEVALVLSDERPELRALACGTLRALDSAAGYRPLAACLDDEDATVADAAWQALRSISGMELTHDPVAVRRLLQLE